MFDSLKATLDRLRRTLSDKADEAQGRAQDTRNASYAQQAYAAGESHAYNDASERLRDAQAEGDAPAADDDPA